jgi:hypothetical protein
MDRRRRPVDQPEDHEACQARRHHCERNHLSLGKIPGAGNK